MMDIEIQSMWKTYDASITLGCIEADVEVVKYDEQLWHKINTYTEKLQDSLNTDDIAFQPNIAAARRVYKVIGQDPARYRLSAEALLRRIVKGKALYQINNVVDIVNVVSLYTGISIGGYDTEHIQGNVCFGLGEANEPYEAIGKGQYNSAHLPVLRDDKGAFGTPTSDSKRTAVRPETTSFLMVFFGFTGTQNLESNMKWAADLLLEHGGSSNPVIHKELL